MNANAVVLGAAAMGLVVNTMALLTVAWKGGELGQTLKTLAAEVALLRAWREENTKWREEITSLLSRVVAQFDSLERRMERYEDKH